MSEIARDSMPASSGNGAATLRQLRQLRQLRLVALVEGASFVILLFVAMPLKYLVGLPLAVRIVGSIHGVLFIAFALVLIRVTRTRAWSFRRSLLAFVSSIVPFGTFVFDRSLRREIAAVTQETAECLDGVTTRNSIAIADDDS